jgi:muramoyltetrapeptide carboxypeptidase
MVLTPLKSGDLLGVIATSSPARTDRFAAGLAAIERAGFRSLVVGEPCAEYGTDRFLFASASTEQRAGHLRELFLNPEVKAIIAARGAGGVQELLPLVDEAVVKGNPKPFIGFSDSTALLLRLSRLGAPVIHGPHVESFTNANSDVAVNESLNSLVTLLKGGSPLKGLVMQQIAHPGDFGAPLTGGNLSVVASLCGTPWQLHAAGRIVFLEETNEKPHRLYRMLMQLRLSGALSGAVGICLGLFTKCESSGADGRPIGPSAERVIKETLEPLGIPVYGGLPCGHLPGNLALPFFGEAKVSGGELTVYLP